MKCLRVSFLHSTLLCKAHLSIAFKKLKFFLLKPISDILESCCEVLKLLQDYTLTRLAKTQKLVLKSFLRSSDWVMRSELQATLHVVLFQASMTTQ